MLTGYINAQKWQNAMWRDYVPAKKTYTFLCRNELLLQSDVPGEDACDAADDSQGAGAAGEDTEEQVRILSGTADEVHESKVLQ